jgi:hypothetical protein
LQQVAVTGAHPPSRSAIIETNPHIKLHIL